MQRAAGLRSLKGFSDAAAKARRWHQFNIRRTALLKRFLRDVELLVLEGRIVVEVDGMRVRVKPNVAAWPVGRISKA
jgi:very-short-patch-repair endonuclease